MSHGPFHCFNNNNYKRKESSKEHTQVSDQDWVSADKKKSDRDIGGINNKRALIFGTARLAAGRL